MILLLGCGGFGLGSTSPGDTAPAAPVVTRIAPSWGRPELETLVTIEGENFAEPVTVGFGNATVDATVTSDGVLVVSAPAAGMEVTVDVTVTAAGGSVVVPDGFRYLAEEPDTTTWQDTGDTGDSGEDTDPEDSDSGIDNSGKVSGLVQMSYTVYACTACFGITEPLDVAAAAVFHEATNGSWNDWLPPKGDCVENTVPSTLSTRYLDAGDRVFLYTSSTTMTLSSDADNTYSVGGLEQSDWDQNSGYDLEATGGSDVASLTLRDVATTPGGFDSFSPSSLITTDPYQAFSARFSAAGGGTVGWSPRGSDEVMVLVDIYSPAGSYQTSWTCRDDDTGSFDIPGSVFAGEPSNSLLVVGVYRYVTGEAIRDDDGSTVESTVSFGVIGTGIVQ